jgi:K+/H+ antiporter YhaU regulatory subunit KhtT
MSETITIGDNDAAVIIRENGKTELVIPKEEDEDAVISETAAEALRVAVFLNNEEAISIVDAEIDKQVEEQKCQQ